MNTREKWKKIDAIQLDSKKESKLTKFKYDPKIVQTKKKFKYVITCQLLPIFCMFRQIFLKSLKKTHLLN